MNIEVKVKVIDLIEIVLLAFLLGFIICGFVACSDVGELGHYEYTLPVSNENQIGLN